MLTEYRPSPEPCPSILATVWSARTYIFVERWDILLGDVSSVGFGGERDGSIGVFDVQTNELLQTIVAPEPENPASGEPFLLYPHGISANEDLGLMLVTSTVHPDLVTGMGNTVTLIDMATNQPVQTVLVGESWEDLSQPVEVLMLRDGLPSYALVTTVMGGDIWTAPFDEETGRLGNSARSLTEAPKHWESPSSSTSARAMILRATKTNCSMSVLPYPVW
jgi:DNA-binding beta-propeller fold protein YncE